MSATPLVIHQSISVETAKKILGEKYKHLSDKQVELILNSLYRISNKIVREIETDKTI